MERSGLSMIPSAVKQLVPLNALSAEGLKHATRNLDIRTLPSGQVIFRRGDTDNRTVYLLAGKLEMVSPDRREVVEAGSAHAKHPLANLKPRQFTATALTQVVVAFLNSQLLDKLLAFDQMASGPVAGYEVTEYHGPADAEWMLQMLQTNAFLRLPSGNIQALFSRFQELHVITGDVIIRQGDEGDFYYVIKHGTCRVTRKSDNAEVQLAELSDGKAFGEESLLSDQPRNATVTMVTNGVLMRLAKKDFTALMEEPLLQWVDHRQAAAMVKRGAAMLDVRLESEFKTGSIKGAQNLPLYLVRLKAGQLDRARPYVVFCDTGSRSAAAAFLLGERGFQVSVLRGGLIGLANSSAA